MNERDLQPGDVVQLCPEVGNPAFAYSLMVVTEPKSWGAQGYVQVLGTRDGPGGQAYYRVKWAEMEYVGRAEWVVADGVGVPDGQVKPPSHADARPELARWREQLGEDA